MLVMTHCIKPSIGGTDAPLSADEHLILRYLERTEVIIALANGVQALIPAPATVSELMKLTGRSRSTVYHQLKCLLRARLVRWTAKGWIQESPVWLPAPSDRRTLISANEEFDCFKEDRIIDRFLRTLNEDGAQVKPKPRLYFCFLPVES